MRGKGGKDRKKTTSRGRKVKRLRAHFSWPNANAETLDRELSADLSARKSATKGANP